MDALNHFTKEQITANYDFSIGDTIRVFVKIKEGERERVQAFEVLSLPRSMAASLRPLPFAAYPTALALRGYSPSTHRTSTGSKSSAKVRFAERSFTTCVTALVKLLK